MLKLRNKEVKCFNLGGGAEKKMTCDKAATRFVEEILGKDLSTSSVRFPAEKLSIGSIPVPLQSEEENKEKAKEIQAKSAAKPDNEAASKPAAKPGDEAASKQAKKVPKPGDNERQAFEKYISNQYPGAMAEFKVWKYLEKISKTPPTALLHSYDLKMFRLFTGIQAKPADKAASKQAKSATKPGDEAASKQDKPAAEPGDEAASKQAKPAAEPGDEAASKQAPKAGDEAASKDKKEKNLEELTNQEWDFFLLSSEYKAFIHIEVKAGKVSEFSNILLLL